MIINSTFYDNYGGQVSAVGAHHGTIINSTFRSPKVDPQASPFGPIIAGNLTLVNNIIEGKSADDRSVCIGIITDGGNNLQYPTSSCVDSIEVGDPRLSEPTDNGGRTLTLALQAGSAAIGRIKGETCPDSDQRSYLPPITDKSQVVCDIGAFQTTYITATTSDVQAQE
ncbi:MAG: choice-of-anchor Q domain-containing protein [Anaerolineae bacterium]